MKILFITHYSDLYGANRSMLNLIDGLKTHHVEAIVLCPTSGPLIEELKKRKVPALIVFYHSWVYHKELGFLKTPIKITADFLTLLRTKNKIKEINPDIIYSNSSIIGFGSFLSIYLKKPHVWHIREFAKLHYNLKFDIGNYGVRYFLNKASAVIAISEAIKTIVLNKVEAKKYVVYNGVINKSSITTNQKSINKNKPIRFLIAGLLSQNKYQLEAIKAFHIFTRSFPNSKLMVVGDGHDNRYIEQLKKESHHLIKKGNITFEGFVHNMETIYKKTDILLMCSKNEGMGRVTVEAMSHGIPVIGYNGGATPELIENGYNGLLYSNDHLDLAANMIELATDSSKYAAMSINSLNKVKDNYTIEKYAKNIYEILKSVVD